MLSIFMVIFMLFIVMFIFIFVIMLSFFIVFFVFIFIRLVFVIFCVDTFCLKRNVLRIRKTEQDVGVKVQEQYYLNFIINVW